MEWYRTLVTNNVACPDELSIRIFRWLISNDYVTLTNKFCENNSMSAPAAIDCYKYLYHNGYSSQRVRFITSSSPPEFRRWLITFTLAQEDIDFDVLREIVTFDEFTSENMEEVLHCLDEKGAAWVLYNCTLTDSQLDAAAQIVLDTAAERLSHPSCNELTGWHMDALERRPVTARAMALAFNHAPTTLAAAEALEGFGSGLDTDVLSAVVTQVLALDPMAHNSSRDIRRAAKLITKLAVTQHCLDSEQFSVMASFEAAYPDTFVAERFAEQSSAFFTENNFETYTKACSPSPEANAAAMDAIAVESNPAVQQWLACVLVRHGSPDRATVARLAKVMHSTQRIVDLAEFERFAPLETLTVLDLMRAMSYAGSGSKAFLFTLSEDLESVYVENDRLGLHGGSSANLLSFAVQNCEKSAVKELVYRVPMGDLDGSSNQCLVEKLHETLGDDADVWQTFEVVASASTSQSAYECATVAMNILAKQR
jgi:hypothetical protein